MQKVVAIGLCYLTVLFSSNSYAALENIEEYTEPPDETVESYIVNVKRESVVIGSLVIPDERYTKPLSFSLRYENVAKGVVRIFVDEQDYAPLMNANLIKIFHDKENKKVSHVVIAKSYPGESQLISRAAVLAPISVALQNKGVYNGWIVRTGGGGYFDVNIADLTADSIAGDKQKSAPDVILLLKVISVPESKIMRLDISSGYAKELNEKKGGK